MTHRKAETLIEILVAMGIFVTVMAGVFEFMANQTIALARNREREKIMYHAQKFIISGDFSQEHSESWGTSFDIDGGVLTVSRGSYSVMFRIE